MATQAIEEMDDGGEAGEVAARHDISGPLKRVSANLVRDWARAALVPAALQRLYEIGMGQTKFATPTVTGAVLDLEAPPAVQRAALRDVISVGVPGQLGIVGDAEQLPGVMAFGEWELEEARAEVHGNVRKLPESVTTGGIEVPAPEAAVPYEAPADHEVVEIVETADGTVAADQAPHEPVVDPVRSLAREFLARRRSRTKK